MVPHVTLCQKNLVLFWALAASASHPRNEKMATNPWWIRSNLLGLPLGRSYMFLCAACPFHQMHTSSYFGTMQWRIDVLPYWLMRQERTWGTWGLPRSSNSKMSPRSFLASSLNMEAHQFFIASFQNKTTYASGGMDKRHRWMVFKLRTPCVAWREGVLRDNNDGVVHTGKGEWLN